ncbi:hypothetical protein H6P81_017262 [Aristolochia fimbriata]|uniref:Importin subunit alpha n=1 Tax=Aristolochia fimbriata TaxID=158543 RepID=A0AAV7E1Z2_ARIFI|nr:hypothetical protein H6P81_017262 [Aristolochia fimbriata]
MTIFWKIFRVILPDVSELIWSEDRNQQLRGTIKIRDLLSRRKNPPVEEIVRSGAVERLVEFLSRDDFPRLQLQSAGVLCSITSGTSENAKLVVDHGAVPSFVKLLGSPCDEIREQAIRVLGNIAGHSAGNRDVVLGHGALVPLLAMVLKDHTKLSTLRIIARTIFNLCKGKPEPPMRETQLVLSALERLLRSNDAQILEDASRAISHITDDGAEDRIQAVIDAGLCPRLIRLLSLPSPTPILAPALRAVGNIAAGDDDQTQTLIHHRALHYLCTLLTHHRDQNIKREACWVVSNIAAGNENQIHALIKSGVVRPLIRLLRNRGDPGTEIEVVWAIANIAFGGTRDQIKFLASQGCIGPLCDQLARPDSRIATVCLKALEIILKVGEEEQMEGKTGGINLYAKEMDEANGFDNIEKLRRHGSSVIYEQAARILCGYRENRDDALFSRFWLNFIPVMWRRAVISPIV